MRIGTQCQAAVTIFAKSAGWMPEVAFQRLDERIRARLPAAAWIERAVTASVSQQRKGLILEIEDRINDTAVLIHGRDNGAVALRKSFAQKIERMLACFAPWPVPSEPPGFVETECLPGRNSNASGQRDRPSIKIDSLMKASRNVIRAYVPPYWKGSRKQPIKPTFRLSDQWIRHRMAMIHLDRNILATLRVRMATVAPDGLQNLADIQHPEVGAATGVF